MLSSQKQLAPTTSFVLHACSDRTGGRSAGGAAWIFGLQQQSHRAPFGPIAKKFVLNVTLNTTALVPLQIKSLCFAVSPLCPTFNTCPQPDQPQPKSVPPIYVPPRKSSKHGISNFFIYVSLLWLSPSGHCQSKLGLGLTPIPEIRSDNTL
jgi:hypothetical protein